MSSDIVTGASLEFCRMYFELFCFYVMLVAVGYLNKPRCATSLTSETQGMQQ